MVRVRPATVADAPAMGRVHVRAWQAAYRGHMPDDYLDGLRPEDREAHWEGALARDDLPGTILVAERAGEVIGFAETVLWVLPGNARAHRFYGTAGWVADGASRSSEVFGVAISEVRYRRRSTSQESSSATPPGTR